MNVRTIRDLNGKDCGHTFWITESRGITQRGLRIGSASGDAALCVTPVAGNIIEVANPSDPE